MIQYFPTITGSLTVNGDLIVTGTGSMSASLALNSNLLQGTGSTGFATTASLTAISSSQQQISASLLNVVANYATTGSNSFRADQSITGSLVVSSTITAQTLVVQTVTSSILYSSGSNLFGNALNNTQTFTGSVNITGSTTLNGGLIGTSAAFSSPASRTILINSTNANGPYITLQANGSDEFYIGKSNGVGAGSGYYDIYANAAGGGLRFFVSGSASPSLTIALTGATTFNSSDAGGWYSGFSNSSSNFAYMGATAQFANSGGTTTDFGIRSANALAFYTGGGNERMRITSGGNLQVTGSATFSGTVTVASPFTIKALNPYIQWQDAAGTRLGYIQHATNLVMSADTGSIILTNASGNCLTITSTGAASFLNSLSLNSASGISGAQGFLFFNNSGTNAGSRNWKISNDQIDWGDFILQYSSTQTGATSNTALAITSGGNITVPNLLTPNRLSLSAYTTLYGKKVVKADGVSSFAFNLSTMFPEMSSTFTSNVVGCFGVYTIFRAGVAETGTFSISRNSGGAWSVSAFSVQTSTGAYSLSNVTGSGTTITMTFNTAVYVIVEVTAMIE